VSRESGQVTEALGFYRQIPEILERLADADPTDVETQFNLSFYLNMLGDMSRQSGQLTEALGFYRRCLEVFQKLADADPTDAETQRDLFLSHYRLGLTYGQLFDYRKSAASMESAVNIAEQVQDRGLLSGSIEGILSDLKRDRAISNRRLVATVEWRQLLEQPDEELPGLLAVRIAVLANQRKFEDVAQSAAHLRALMAEGTGSDEQAGMLFDAACGYGLCAGGVVPVEGEELSEADQTRRRNFQNLALDCLKESIAAGWRNFEHMRKDPDLTSLHDLPEFQQLANPSRRPEPPPLPEPAVSIN